MTSRFIIACFSLIAVFVSSPHYDDVHSMIDSRFFQVLFLCFWVGFFTNQINMHDMSAGMREGERKNHSTFRFLQGQSAAKMTTTTPRTDVYIYNIICALLLLRQRFLFVPPLMDVL